MTDIVEELRNDRENGAKRLVAEYKAGLLTLARRLYDDPSDAEELVNRTFSAVVEGIDGFLSQSSFFTWMCQILVNLHANDIRRKSHANETYPGELPDVADNTADGEACRAIDASLLRDAIESLPQDMRKTLVMHYFMDFSVKDVARLLAIPVGTVKRRLFYARQILAVKLGAAAKKPGVKALVIAIALCALTLSAAAAWRASVRSAVAVASASTAEDTVRLTREALVEYYGELPPDPFARPLSDAAGISLSTATAFSPTEEKTMNAASRLAAATLAAASVPAVLADYAYYPSGGPAEDSPNYAVSSPAALSSGQLATVSAGAALAAPPISSISQGVALRSDNFTPAFILIVR